jgi:competence ComEA-like helix-hairpin-helix protein
MLMRPLPPGFEYPWRAASEARVRIGASLAVARASLVLNDAFVQAHAVASTPIAPQVASEPALVDLNTATLEELDALPRVGPAMAAAIVQARPFRRVDDLRRVRGVGSTTFAQLRPLVTVTAP